MHLRTQMMEHVFCRMTKMFINCREEMSFFSTDRYDFMSGEVDEKISEDKGLMKEFVYCDHETKLLYAVWQDPVWFDHTKAIGRQLESGIQIFEDHQKELMCYIEFYKKRVIDGDFVDEFTDNLERRSPTRTLENSAARFSRLGCADDAIANFPPTLDAGPRRRLRRGPARRGS